jgi:hypothetical protein
MHAEAILEALPSVSVCHLNESFGSFSDSDLSLLTKGGLFFSKGKMAQVIGATQGWNLRHASRGNRNPIETSRNHAGTLKVLDIKSLRQSLIQRLIFILLSSTFPSQHISHPGK